MAAELPSNEQIFTETSRLVPLISPATLSEILMKALELQASLSFYRKKLRRTRTGMSSVVSN